MNNASVVAFRDLEHTWNEDAKVVLIFFHVGMCIAVDCIVSSYVLK